MTLEKITHKGIIAREIVRHVICTFSENFKHILRSTTISESVRHFTSANQENVKHEMLITYERLRHRARIVEIELDNTESML